MFRKEDLAELTQATRELRQEQGRPMNTWDYMAIRQAVYETHHRERDYIFYSE